MKDVMLNLRREMAIQGMLTHSLAYTTYAFFEWSLILYDVAFDAVTALDFQNFEFFVVDVTHGSNFATTSTEEG